MHSGSTGKLSYTADGIFHLLAGYHHKVGKLVDDDYDLRQLFGFLVLGNLRIVNDSLDLFVVSLKIS